MSETEIPSMDGLLPSIKVYPFPLSLGTTPELKKALISCPKCRAVDNFYNMGNETRFESHYCKGNCSPEFRCIEGHTHETNCAGITQEHFHIRCLCCGFISFLSMPEEVK